MKPGLHSFDSYQEMVEKFQSFNKAHCLRWRKTQQQGKMVLDSCCIPAFLKTKKNLNWSSRGRKTKGVILNYDGVPYIISGREFYTCHQGPDVDRVQKEKRKQKSDTNQHAVSVKRRSHFQTTKKRDCPATVEMLYIIKLPDFSIPSNSRWFRTQTAQHFHLDLEFSELGKISKWELRHQYHLRLPAKQEHRNHSLIKMPSIYQFTANMDTEEQNNMPTQNDVPFSSDESLGPPEYVLNENVAQTNEWMLSGEAQETILSGGNKKEICRTLKQKCEKWVLNGDNYHLSGVTESEDFFFIYQSGWQQRLLSLYGDEVCFIDSGHRTCKLPFPTYFLRVPTNVCHIVVGFFICEKDDTDSIEKALIIFSRWNNKWRPRNFFMDCTLLQKRAFEFEAVFKGAGVYLSDFHRESLWSEWLSNEQTELNEVRGEVLKALHEIARSTSLTDFEAAKKHLQQSKLWIEHPALQEYYNTMWQPMEEKWVTAFRDNSSNVLLLGRLASEKENDWVREELGDFEDGVGLANFLSFLVMNFIPSTYKRYAELNLKNSDGYKNYCRELPEFLCHRTKKFVNHVMKRLPNENDLSEVTRLTPQKFRIVNSTGRQETVFLGAGKHMPYCSCMDWAKWRLPCKHLLKIVTEKPDCSWGSICPAYRESSFFKLDEELFQSSYDFAQCNGNSDAASNTENAMYVMQRGRCANTLDESSTPDGDYIITIIPKTDQPNPMSLRDRVLNKWRSILDRIDSLDDEQLKHLDGHFTDVLAYVECDAHT